MTRKKLEHFAEMKKWAHIYEPGLNEDLQFSGTWGEKVILELGCGRGHYTLALAKRIKEATVVGVDIKGSRIWHGGKEALEGGLENVRFLRGRIEDLEDYFEEGELDEIWITFPDPHPREGKEKKRLTSQRFLEIYSRLLKKGGKVNLKTDDEDLFNYSLATAKKEGWKIEGEVRDVHGSDCAEILKEVRTQYEEKFMKEGRKIF
jgi:tRNA (guanine-N7-)-methyltransferase